MPDIPGLSASMVTPVCNDGSRGVASMGTSASLSGLPFCALPAAPVRYWADIEVALPMPEQQKIRRYVLAIHGGIFLLLGIALIYLRATMTMVLFETTAILIAVILSAASLLIAAVTDWAAAFATEVARLHKIIYYMLTGALLAVMGFYIATFPDRTMRIMLLMAAAHAAAMVLWSAFYLFHRGHTAGARASILIPGLGSLAFVVVFIRLQQTGDREATGLLGAYAAFIGAKMLFLAWRLKSLSETTAAETAHPGTQRLF
ncbi:hypothetical protein [Paracidobacterium acidisoli]|uniref:Uncharacterized protein n=1 Tax=Paracidobacterium acidisoli TaxID=2303751 RepID=A0A372ISH2_9BACT|nr:hypothetical protein [Paracidobacterium acidisoli]MBT9330793.1 hypothetical protein [Paracidobacterium acidisoli]